MSETTIRQNSLILYRNRPGRVISIDKRIEIELENQKTIKTSKKNLHLLHPGPIKSLSDLHPQSGEVQDAWELMIGETTSVAELAELAYGEWTPATAWAIWQEIDDGLYFIGNRPDKVVVNEPEIVAQKRVIREAKKAKKIAWEQFLARLEKNHFIDEDQSFIKDITSLALEQQEHSRVLRALGRSETAQNAHQLLLDIGYWDHTFNPYPQRIGASTNELQIELPDLVEETRLDLTHLLSLAIDDEGSRDPDDALSWDNGRLWVHIADVAALITRDSIADLEARERGANLYLPEGTVPMLPREATERLALGLSESGISPALSFALDLNESGEIEQVDITPSWIRVTRTTYEIANELLGETPYKELYQAAQRYEARRYENGAININLPEVKIRVKDGQITIRPIPPLQSRDLVREAMLMTGEAVAKFALEHDIPLPFSAQDEPDTPPEERLATTTAEMFALRRTLKRSQHKNSPSPHSGLGMAAYVQATSPLRRYLDMVVHQQLRAYLRNEPIMDEQELMERVGAAEAVRGTTRLAERLSNQHWTLNYLQQNPDWQGEGIIVEKRGNYDLVLIPSLAYETRSYQNKHSAPDDVVNLTINKVNLAELDAHFRISK